MLKAYYAHCIAEYGTKTEFYDVSDLFRLGFDVLNPSEPQYKPKWETKGMSYAKDLLNTCSVLAFRRLPDGRIPAGVAYEIEYAKERGLPIIELPYIQQSKVMTREQTREYINKQARKRLSV